MKKITLLMGWMFILITAGAQDTWVQKKDFGGGGRIGMMWFTIGDIAYVGTGADNGDNIKSDFWAYDKTSDSWSQIANFANNPDSIRIYGNGFSVGNKGYAGTGIVASYNWRKDMWEYDPASNSWTQIPDFLGGYRITAVAFSIGNKGYMGTGNYRRSPSDFAIYNRDFYEYDPAAKQWTAKADVPIKGRTNAVGISIGDKGYVGTGFYYYDTRLKDWWQYNPADNTWTQKPDMPDAASPRFNASAFAIGSKGFITTGWYYSGLSDLWEYDSQTEQWTQRNFSPPPRNSAVSFALGNKGYLGMGAVGNSYAADFWEYSPVCIIACPEAQSFCFRSDSIYQIPALTTGGCNFQSISYTITGATSRSGSGTDASGKFSPGISTITWTATDQNNQNSVCSTTVTVNPAIHINIANVFAVNPGGNPNTIYIGYGPSSLHYNASASGGTLPSGGSFMYQWSDGSTDSGITVNPSTPGSYPYTVTVTDGQACNASAAKTVFVVDVRCGLKNDKVSVCKVPTGNPGNKKPVCVGKADVPVLLGTGSYLGSCSVSGPASTGNYLMPTEEQPDLSVYPNPNNGSFIIRINNSVESNSPIEIRIINQFGEIVSRKKLPYTDGTQMVQFDLGTSLKGAYTVQLIRSTGLTTSKIIIY